MASFIKDVKIKIAELMNVKNDDMDKINSIQNKIPKEISNVNETIRKCFLECKSKLLTLDTDFEKLQIFPPKKFPLNVAKVRNNTSRSTTPINQLKINYPNSAASSNQLPSNININV